MSLLDLYSKTPSRVAAAKPDTYEKRVFRMEAAGLNDLVERNQVDPTFRPPLPEDSYIATLFTDSVQ